jgi:gamma-glutamyltranspeptidase/glutathione hydrolase
MISKLLAAARPLHLAAPLLLLGACAAQTAQQAPVAAVASKGAVSAADPRAAEAGREILRQGGSAADAAIATAIALTVVEPQSSGIGGGGFLVHHDGRSRGLTSFDGREEAPAAAGPRWFLDASGKPVADPSVGGRAVGVPGNIRMFALAHAKHGKLPWARLFDPAIRLAENGFPADRARAPGDGRMAARSICPDAMGALHLLGCERQCPAGRRDHP